MENKNELKPKIGFLPFFTDVNVYLGLRMIATNRKLKMQTVIIEIVRNHYLESMKSELNVNQPVEFMKQLASASAKQRTANVADYIEFACGRFLEQEMDKLKPKHRG